MLANVFRVLNPKLVQQAIDSLKQQSDFDNVKWYALGIVAISLIQGFFTFMMRRTIIVASREIENDLRNDIFWKLEQLPQSFYNRYPTGDIMSRTTNDMNAVRSVLGPGIAYSINTIIAFLFVLPMMFRISPSLMGLVLIPFPVMALVVNRFGRAIHKRYDKIQAQLAKISTFVQENLAGASIVRAFVREDQQIDAFLKLNQDYVKKNISYARVQAAFHPSLFFIIGIATLLVLVGGGRLVINGTISIGNFTAFMLYLGMLVWPSIALGWVIGLFQQGSASMKRIREILDAESDVKGGNLHPSPETFKGEIEFRRLNFAYGQGQPILKNLEMKIPAGKTVGILGPTGSGKSTLVRLIPHLYPINNNELIIDGYDINQYDLHSLRQMIGMVPQQSFLFSDTIFNNIAMAKPQATREEVERAAKTACIYDEIMEFPDGFDSVLGELGLNLSGGQKQRVSLARALLASPKILILDDAFSALDTYTEEQILKNLKAYFSDRTVILISHRISTLQNADLIYVMEDGQIVQRGVHQELLNQDGFYARVYQKQLLEEEIEAVE